MESKYKVGDRVLIKDHIAPGGAMIGSMLEEHGGQVRTISRVMLSDPEEGYYTYEVAEDDYLYKYEFNDEDIEELVCTKRQIPQRIEIPVPGGHLVAETCDWGGTHPGIFVSFVKSGELVEQALCFAEVDVENNPDVISLGTFYEDGRDVKEILEYPICKKEEE